jgi:hypothetical protein
VKNLLLLFLFKLEEKMSFFIYRTETEVLDPTLLTETDPTLALGPGLGLTTLIFAPGIEEKYLEVVRRYKQFGIQIGFKRSFADNKFVTERVFVTEEDALSMKAELDALYAENDAARAQGKCSDKFSFCYSIVEISEEDFVNNEYYS